MNADFQLLLPDTISHVSLNIMISNTSQPEAPEDVVKGLSTSFPPPPTFASFKDTHVPTHRHDGIGKNTSNAFWCWGLAVLHDGLLDVAYIMDLPTERIPEVLGSFANPADLERQADCFGSMRVPWLEVECQDGMQVHSRPTSSMANSKPTVS